MRPGGAAGLASRAAPGRMPPGAAGRSAVLMVLLAVMCAAGAAAQAPDPARADYDWALHDLAGRELMLEEFRGRPVVLNVWATWCAPCVAELASLDRLARSLAGSDVIVLAVSPESRSTVRSFLRRYDYRLAVAVEDQRMPASFGLRALPTTYILDRDGRIVFEHRGAADWDRDVVRRFLLHL